MAAYTLATVVASRSVGLASGPIPGALAAADWLGGTGPCAIGSVVAAIADHADIDPCPAGPCRGSCGTRTADLGRAKVSASSVRQGRRARIAGGAVGWIRGAA